MHHFPRYCVWTTALLAMTLLAISFGQRLDKRTDLRQSINHWNIHELTNHLNSAGLQVRLESIRKDGVMNRKAFLVTTHKTWQDLNRLNKDSRQLPEWRGTVFCERVEGKDPVDVVDLWGDHGLVVGRFVFYGDAELLQRIDDILLQSGTMPSLR
jgi:hypothetical protein